MQFDIDQAREFIAAVDLSGTPRAVVAQDAATEAKGAFDAAKAQGQVVGSGLFSFAQGVDAAVRTAIADSALLAQLVASKRVAFDQAPLDWFRAYAEALQNVGWTLQEDSWNDYSAAGQAAEVDQKIIEVVTAALGPAPTALAIISSAVNALKAMQPESSWITVFSRESQRGRLARFQIGLVEKGADSDVFVSLLACLIEAENTITQVLFFKWRAARAHFKASAAKVSVNRASMDALSGAIREKIRAYQSSYLSSIADL